MLILIYSQKGRHDSNVTQLANTVYFVFRGHIEICSHLEENQNTHGVEVYLNSTKIFQTDFNLLVNQNLRGFC